jgi:hypothetical protein
MLETDVARRLIAAHHWHHDFEVLPDVRTHGTYNPEGLWLELELPEDLTGIRLGWAAMGRLTSCLCWGCSTTRPTLTALFPTARRWRRTGF